MHKQHGFTVVEVLVVIVAIAILATISTAVWNSARGYAIDEETKTRALALRDAIEQYYRDTNEYPKCPARPSGAAPSDPGRGDVCSSGSLASQLKPYIDPLPQTPEGLSVRYFDYAVHHNERRFSLKLVHHDNTDWCKTGKNIDDGELMSDLNVCEF